MAKKKPELETQEPERTTVKSKTWMVKEAIAEGLDKNPDIVAWVKQKYGLDIVPNYISMIKGKMKKGTGKATTRKPRATRQPSGNGDMPEELSALKTLIIRLGKDGVKGLVDLFDSD